MSNSIESLSKIEQEPTKNEQETPKNEQKLTKTEQEPTIIFLFDMKNWNEVISPISKIDLFDIAPKIATQFYMDFGVNAYVLILTKSKWSSLNFDTKKKFMYISRRIKEEMEGLLPTTQRELYENSDIFELLMKPSQQQTETNTLEKIDEDEEIIEVPEDDK